MTFQGGLVGKKIAQLHLSDPFCCMVILVDFPIIVHWLHGFVFVMTPVNDDFTKIIQSFDLGAPLRFTKI